MMGLALGDNLLNLNLRTEQGCLRLLKGGLCLRIEGTS